MLRGSTLLVIAVLTVAAAAVVLWVYPSRTDFAATNPYWNGLEVAQRAFVFEGVRDLARLPKEPSGTALISIPAVAPSSPDLDALARYVERGGRLILLDDFGAGNTILRRLGIAARFSGRPLADALFNVRHPRLPRIMDVSAALRAEGIGSLVLNHATVMEEAGDLSVLARSSPLSYLDTNDNNRRDVGELAGPFVVAAEGAIGAGRLVVVADPSLLVNTMLDRGQNRRLLALLLRGADTVYLDEAHLPQVPLDAAKAQLADIRAALSYPLVAYLLIALALAVPLAWLLRRHGGGDTAVREINGSPTGGVPHGRSS